jgi:hypothetical protein
MMEEDSSISQPSIYNVKGIIDKRLTQTPESRGVEEERNERVSHTCQLILKRRAIQVIPGEYGMTMIMEE